MFPNLWHLRRAIVGDEATLRAVRLEAVSEAPEAFCTTYERELARTTADWQRWLSPDAAFILDAPGGANGLVACRADATDPTIVLLQAMWVHPTLRGTAAAADLVTAVINWAATEGARTVRLEVFEANPRARQFYERLGFRDTGHRTPHESDGRVEVRMERAVTDGPAQ